MKQKPLNFIIPLIVYPFDLMVSINQSNDDIEKSLKAKNVDYTDVNVRNESSTRRGRTIIFKGNQTLIRLFDFEKTPECYGYLAHEVFHAVEFVMERVGMKLCFKSNEAYAYLVGYITTEIYKKL